MSDNQPVLEVVDLKKSFGGIDAVDGVSFDVEAGSITGLIGPNGAGKTTTFNLISGFYTPDGGEVRYRGTDLATLMRPNRPGEQAWRIGVSGLLVAGGVVAATNPVGTAALAGMSALGFGAGAGLYKGSERLRRDLLDYQYSRPFRVAETGLVRTFQITRELTGMTVLENLMFAPQNQTGENVLMTWLPGTGVREEEAKVREQAKEILELLEIDHLADEYAGNLSGGQRKLLELGRVLMMDPDLILLDEPVAGVNPTLTKKLLERIETLSEEGYTFCIVEHDMEVIMNLSDTIIVMDQGKKLMQGTPKEVKSDERVIDAYLGG